MLVWLHGSLIQGQQLFHKTDAFSFLFKYNVVGTLHKEYVVWFNIGTAGNPTPTPKNLLDTCFPNTCTFVILSFRPDRSGQTVQTQIRLLLEEQSDQGLHCLLFHLHLFDKIP